MSDFPNQNEYPPTALPYSDGQRITHLLRVAQEIRCESRQTQEAL